MSGVVLRSASYEGKTFLNKCADTEVFQDRTMKVARILHPTFRG